MTKDTISADALIAKIKSGKVNRRDFNKILAGAGLSMGVTPMLSGGASAADPNQGSYFTWSGYDIPEFFGEYQAKNGTLPNFNVFGDTSEALTKMKAGFTVDVAHPCNSGIPRWMASGLFQPLDTSKLSHWGDVTDSLKNLSGAVVDGKPHFAPFDWGQTSITYRTDLVDLGGQEESWGILWDERYKGRIGVIASPGDTWWCAAIYAGVPFDEIDTEKGIAEVEKALKKLHPNVRFYTDDMTSLEQALASGELVAAMTWNESPVSLKGQGLPVAWANPKEGALTWVCGAMIHKDAPNLDKAHDIINSMLSPESGAFLINDYGYGHSNKRSFDLVSDERLAELGLTRNPDDMLMAGHFQGTVDASFDAMMNTRFEEIKAGF